MIDAFKNLAVGSKREVVVSERHELEQLIQTARAERAGMDAALQSLRERSANLTPIARSLEHLTQTMTGAATKLEEIGESLAGLDGRTRELEQLGGQIQGFQEAARQAREDSSAAIEAIAEAEKKLGPLAQLQALGQDTDERLVALNALAERVSLKAKAIDSQQQTVEHALVQSNRVQEMVWSMEQQIVKLSEGMRRAATAEETLARLEKLSTEATQRLEGAARLHAATEQQAATLEKRAGSLFESMHAQLETLAVDKKAVEGVD